MVAYMNAVRNEEEDGENVAVVARKKEENGRSQIKA